MGGKGTMRRKYKKPHKTTSTDDKRLQNTLKRLGVNTIPGIEEVNLFFDNNVVHFTNPKVQASIAAAAAPVPPPTKQRFFHGPSPTTVSALVSENDVQATLLPSGKYRCPHCGKTSKAASMMTMHLYWHTADAEMAYRHMPYHCPFCYFASKKGPVVSRHISEVHKKPHELYRKPCGSCGRPMYNAARHKCLPGRWADKTPRRKKIATPTKAIRRSPSTVALTASGETIPMPEPVPLGRMNKHGDDHECKLCGKRGTKEAVRIHMKFHSPRLELEGRLKPAHCPICFFSSLHPSSVAAHILRTHNKSPSAYESQCESCQICVYNAEAHARFHGGDGGGGSSAKARREAMRAETPVTTARSPLPLTPVKSAPAAGSSASAGRAIKAIEKGGSGGAKRVVAAGSLMACGNSQARHDCPFCDAFFGSKRMYDRHLTLNHQVGTEQRLVECRFRFCCAEGSPTHYKLFHKGSEDRSFRCSQCDSTYTSAENLRTHTARQHADESVPAFELREDGHCWCSNLASGGAITLFKFHLIAYHSVLVRGYPGPRPAPYSCPRCPAELQYQELIEHMTTSHDWVFSAGDEYLGSGRPRHMEVGCPLCYHTAPFESLFKHMQEKHQWTFLESREGARERQGKTKARQLAVAKASKLVKKAAVRQIASASQSSRGEPMSEAVAAAPNQNIYDCPFCDAFFASKGDYAGHCRRFHSGLEHTSLEGQNRCTARYCYNVGTSRHDSFFHKNFAKRVLPCDHCDGMFSSRNYLDQHRISLHSVPRPPRRVMGNVVCRCDLQTKSIDAKHLSAYHFRSARLPPGPRPQPYRCPECGASMVFDQLKKHLTQEHCWRLKETGPDLFALNAASRKDDPPASMSSTSTQAVASIPKSVSVTALPPVKQESKPKSPIKPQLDAARAFSGRHRIGELAEDPDRIDCPFCDAFFLARNRYMRHMRLAHSGSNGIADSTCTFRYCYNMSSPATTEKHIATFHKGAAVLGHKCSFCDRMGRTERSINIHADISHKSQMRLGVQVGDVAECVCDAIGSECESKSLLWLHYVHNHSVQVRSYPGPRSRPYDCPECHAKLPFKDLLNHLQSTHMWRIKNEGDEAFGLNRLDNRNFLDSITVLQVSSSGTSQPVTLSGTPRPTGSSDTARAGSSATVWKRKRKAANHPDEVSKTLADIIACPFCDHFFEDLEEYQRHALANHSGLTRSTSMCPVQYCCAPADAKHLAYHHKTLLKLHCLSCDASFRTRHALNRHIMRAHKWIVDRSDDENPLFRLCSCSVSQLAGMHLYSCHSLAVRGTPGPREEPYLCPVVNCTLQLQFAELVDHLLKDHQWRLKKHGDKPFGDTPVSGAARTKDVPGGSKAPVSRPVVKPTVSTKVKRLNPLASHSRLTFRCHYCSMSASKLEVKRHEETVHRDVHGAFMRFARSCANKRGVYACPFCTFKRDRLWIFRRHLSRSASCRHQLGPSAVPWLDDSGGGAEVEAATGTEDGLSVAEEPVEPPEPQVEQEPRVAPLKIKLFTTGTGVKTGSLDATPTGAAATTAAAAARRRKRERGPWRGFGNKNMNKYFLCHFCPLRGTRGGMKEHMQKEHSEPYAAFTRFVNTLEGKRKPSELKRKFYCPFCSYSTDSKWYMMPHLAFSADCRRHLGSEHQVWINTVPSPDERTLCRKGIKLTAVTEVDNADNAGSPAEVDQPEAPSVDPLELLDSDGAAPERKPPKNRSPLPSKKIHRCRYCGLVAGKMEVWRHQRKVHATVHNAFLAWTESRADAHGTMWCPDPSCGFKTREKWRLRMHVSRSAQCRSQLDESTAWLDQVEDGTALMDADDGPKVKEEEEEDGQSGFADDSWMGAEDVSGDAGAEGDEAVPIGDVQDSPEPSPPCSTANAADELADGSAAREQTGDPGDDRDRPETVPDDPGSPEVEPARANDTQSTPVASTATAAATAANVQSSQTFECLKCSATFSEKALLIAHSQSRHSVRKKRPMSPDRTQPRIDSFFKRAKVD